MSFVVDTSITLAWCFEDERTPATERLLERLETESAVAPGLWVLETANAFLTAQRRRRLTEAQTLRASALLDALPIEVEVGTPPRSALLATGGTHGLSAYDSAYLLLAERRGLPLATLDKALARAAKKAGVPVLPGARR